MSSSPLDAADLRSRVQKVVDSFLTQQEVILNGVGCDVSPLLDSVRTLLSGGKRLRPAFCYWGWRGAAPADQLSDPDFEESTVQAASSLEFLQGCALIHDDVMDGSDTRRGLPAAHRQFAAMHRGQQWAGGADKFGEGAAILLGDLCLSWADELLLNTALPQKSLSGAKRVYNEMRTELMAGQYLDLLEQARGGGSIERALRVVRYKSAKYTIERPLHIGAAIAQAPQSIFDSYTGYGLPLGEAFQLRDDVLGVFGDPEVTGKPAGDDLREGKRTVLIAIACERADKVQSRQIREKLGDQHLQLDDVSILREIIENTGALAYTENLIGELLNRAIDSLSNPDLNPDAAAVLTELAHAATTRKV